MRSAWFAALLLLSACSALLPRSESGPAKTSFADFAQAREAFDEIVPYQTRVADLGRLGFDPFQDPNVTILTYSDITRRFIPSSAVAAESLDRGITDCIAAKDACRAYEWDMKSLKRKRAGNFWLDSLNFKRRTETSGWRFSGLVIVNNDLVVYKLWGGQPSIQEAEENRNPLGPFHGVTESAARRALP
jgi:hypothetical protein